MKLWKKWTPEKEKLAIQYFSENKSRKEIAKALNMCESSISLFKRKVAIQRGDKIECNLCKRLFTHITHKHLKYRHNITSEEYLSQFPNAQLMCESRKKQAREFKSQNLGKTYEEIYGKQEALRKKKIISEKQIGRQAPKKAGTGIAGTRKDTGCFARSTYEANVDRIFIYENKKFADEFDKRNKRVYLIDESGNNLSYQPDRLDVDGLFEKDAFIEIKGYMHDVDLLKINLFRKQHGQLLLISDQSYADVKYSDLESKYKSLIPLWETELRNYKTRPDLYNIKYIPTEIEKYRQANYINQIHKSIINNGDEHIVMISKICTSFGRVRLGKNVYVNNVELVAITNRRKNASKKSSGLYNFELWKIICDNGDSFFVSNTTSTNTFYCYEKIDGDISDFFKDNSNLDLQ